MIITLWYNIRMGMVMSPIILLLLRIIALMILGYPELFVVLNKSDFFLSSSENNCLFILIGIALNL